jgi:hypothetical protein
MAAILVIVLMGLVGAAILVLTATSLQRSQRALQAERMAQLRLVAVAAEQAGEGALALPAELQGWSAVVIVDAEGRAVIVTTPRGETTLPLPGSGGE